MAGTVLVLALATMITPSIVVLYYGLQRAFYLCLFHSCYYSLLAHQANNPRIINVT